MDVIGLQFVTKYSNLVICLYHCVLGLYIYNMLYISFDRAIRLYINNKSKSINESINEKWCKVASDSTVQLITEYLIIYIVRPVHLK